MKPSSRAARRTARAFASALPFAVLLTGITAPCPAHAQNNIAATVNNEIITINEVFDRAMRLHAQDFIAPGNVLRPESAAQIVLGSLIFERLTMQAAARANIAPTDAAINSEVDEVMKDQTLQNAIAAHTVTQDNVRYNLQVQDSRFNLATAGVTVTPEDVEKFYKAHITNYTVPERWSVSLIRLNSADNVPKVEADLKAGKPFADVAKTYSQDPKTKDNGGDAGIVAANDATVPQPIKDAIKALKVGDVSPVVKTETPTADKKSTITVWWFVRLTKKDPEMVHPFADVKDQATKLALLDKAGGYKIADQKTEEFRKTASIKINLPGFQ